MPEPHDLPRPLSALGDAMLADDARVEALSVDVASRVGRCSARSTTRSCSGWRDGGDGALREAQGEAS
jgi:hypothetical protein